jgi:NADP-dependent 3-hydroxy acid dehydrogenase YdfG
MDKMEKVVQTNFTGLIHVTRKAFHLMEKSNDYEMIINIGSVCAGGVPKYGIRKKVMRKDKNTVDMLQAILFS